MTISEINELRYLLKEYAFLMYDLKRMGYFTDPDIWAENRLQTYLIAHISMPEAKKDVRGLIFSARREVEKQAA